MNGLGRRPFKDRLSAPLMDVHVGMGDREGIGKEGDWIEWNGGHKRVGEEINQRR